MDAQEELLGIAFGPVGGNQHIGETKYSTQQQAQQAKDDPCGGRPLAPRHPDAQQAGMEHEIGIDLRSPVKLEQVAKEDGWKIDACRECGIQGHRNDGQYGCQEKSA